MNDEDYRIVPPTGVIRRCARCRQAALIQVPWQRRFAGINLPNSNHACQEFVCQACGAQVLLHPKSTIRIERMFAYVMMPAIFPSIMFFARARNKARAWIDNPVVDGAVAPNWSPASLPVTPIRPARTLPPARRCRCGAAAPCVGIVKRGTWERSFGFRFDYQCDRCSRRFRIHSKKSLATTFAIATSFSLAGALILAVPPGEAVGAVPENRWFGGGLTIFGVAAWAAFGKRLRARLAHPLAA